MLSLLLGGLLTPYFGVAKDFSERFSWNTDSNKSVDHKIKHVFVITLENEGYNETFGANSKAPYLAQTLTAQGALLSQYFGTGHASLDNYIAMISGQAATNETRMIAKLMPTTSLQGLPVMGRRSAPAASIPLASRRSPIS
jgi:hypothetical protein